MRVLALGRVLTLRTGGRAVTSLAVAAAGFAAGAVMMAAGLLAGSPDAFSDQLTPADRGDSGLMPHEVPTPHEAPTSHQAPTSHESPGQSDGLVMRTDVLLHSELMASSSPATRQPRPAGTAPRTPRTLPPLVRSAGS